VKYAVGEGPKKKGPSMIPPRKTGEGSTDLLLSLLIKSKSEQRLLLIILTRRVYDISHKPSERSQPQGSKNKISGENYEGPPEGRGSERGIELAEEGKKTGRCLCTF